MQLLKHIYNYQSKCRYIANVIIDQPIFEELRNYEFTKANY